MGPRKDKGKQIQNANPTNEPPRTRSRLRASQPEYQSPVTSEEEREMAIALSSAQDDRDAEIGQSCSFMFGSVSRKMRSGWAPAFVCGGRETRKSASPVRSDKATSDPVPVGGDASGKGEGSVGAKKLGKGESSKPSRSKKASAEPEMAGSKSELQSRGKDDAGGKGKGILVEDGNERSEYSLNVLAKACEGLNADATEVQGIVPTVPVDSDTLAILPHVGAIELCLTELQKLSKSAAEISMIWAGKLSQELPTDIPRFTEMIVFSA